MAKTAPKPLVVIGTARKPNLSDLKNRSLSGLPDLGPDVELRRAELEVEQAALRELVVRREDGTACSFLRTKIGGRKGASGVSNFVTDIGMRVSSGDAEVNVEKAMVEEDEEKEEEEEDTMGDDEQIPDPTGCVDVPNQPESAFANEGCEPQTAMSNLRNRSPIQLHPYALEREVYRHTVKAGRAE